MRGEIVRIPSAGVPGLLRSDFDDEFEFSADQLRAGYQPVAGEIVDFFEFRGSARDIFLLPDAPKPPPRTGPYYRRIAGLPFFEAYWQTMTRQHFDFKGRMRRADFFSFLILVWILFFFTIMAGSTLLESHMAIAVLNRITGGDQTAKEDAANAALGFLIMAFLAGHSIALFAAIIRRLHDTGRPFWPVFIVLVPWAGWLILLILLLQDSQKEETKYGPSPKYQS
jgi:uncharacterized membrane protein YhaH (DUF805 family)